MFIISASKWLSAIAERSKIIIKKKNGPPLIMDIRRHKSKIDSLHYLEERDEYRASDNKSSQWVGANISYHHKLMGRNNKIGDRVITQRIGLIKRWQWHSSRSDNLCEGCNQAIGGISHPLRHCPHVDMIEVRSRCWKSVEASIMNCDRKFHESLFSITRHMRESEGGEIACCGSFVPKFVSQLTDSNSPVNESYIKSLNKVLKTVVRGTRLILRQAAELQLGLDGVNWRQSAITQYFKPVHRNSITRKVTGPRSKVSNHTSLPSQIKKKNKKSNSIDSNIMYKNRNLIVDHIFDNVTSGDVVYWEFKAG